MSDVAYLSIIDWPDTLSERERAAALAKAAGFDEYTAMLAVRRGTPQVACRLPTDRAADAVASLRSLGVMTFAPTRERLDALPEAQLVKRLAPAKGGTTIEPWRGDAFSLEPGAITLGVQGKVLSSLVTSGVTPGPSETTRAVSAIGGAVLGLPLGGLGRSGGGQPTQHTTEQMVMVLDLWQPLRRLRVVSNRLDSEALSVLAAPSARFDLASNPDRVDLLSRWLAKGGLTIDQSFRAFHCPPDVLVTTTSTNSVGTVKKRTDEGPLFEFYSRWASLLHEEMHDR